MQTSLLLALSLLVGCSPQDSSTTDHGPLGGMALPECGWTKSTETVPASAVEDLDAMLAYLDAIQPTAAEWWDDATTEIVVDLDTAAMPADATQTTWTFDPATSVNGTEEGCAPFHAWTLTLPVQTLATTDGGVTATAASVELACSDNYYNRLPPEDGFPGHLCKSAASFVAPVEVDPTRLPSGAVGPFIASVGVYVGEGIGAWVWDESDFPLDEAASTLPEPILGTDAINLSDTGSGPGYDYPAP
jgi:hypothetical protein